MDDINFLQKKVESLEKRVTVLENILKGSSKGKAGRKNKFNLNQRCEIIQKHNQGISYSKLAEEYHVCKTTIYNICKGKSDGIIIPVHKTRNAT